MSTCSQKVIIPVNENIVSTKQKWLIAVILGILFFLLAFPPAYAVSNTLFGKLGVATVNSQGVPTLGGLVIHSMIFILIVRLFLI